MRANKLYLIISLAFLTLFIFSIAPLAKGALLETSLVSLVIQTETREIYRDYFFEILDLGDYILMPLVSLTKPLEIETSYNREENKLKVEHKPSGKIVEVDLGREIYIDYPEWAKEPPLLHEGEFFVTASLLENIAGVEIIWYPRRQEIVIKVDWPDLDDEEKEPIFKDPWGVITLIPDTQGPEYSLGSLQYKVSGDARKSVFGDWEYFSKQQIYIHGRVRNWGVSLGLSSSYNFSTLTGTISFPLVRAISRGKNHQIILGDSRIDFPGTLGRDNLRGLYFSSPQFPTGGKQPLYTVSGPSEEGSFVRVFLNGVLWKEQMVGKDEMYFFPSIPLVLYRINTIRLELIKPDGTKVEKVENIVGYPKVFAEGTTETVLAGGLYGKPEDPDGNMIGLIFKHSFAPGLSLSIEGVREQELTSIGYEDPKVGLISGFSWRPFGGTVIGLDFLMGGYTDSLDYGLRGSLLQGFKRAHFEGTYSHIQPDVRLLTQEIPGQNLFLEGAYDISDKWGIKLIGDFRYSLPEMVYSIQNRGILGVYYKNQPRYSTSLSLIGGTREFDLEIWNGEFLRVNSIDGGLNFSHSQRLQNFEGSIGLNYLASQLTLPEGEIVLEENLGIKGKAAYSLTKSLRLYGEADLDAKIVDQSVDDLSIDLESSLRYILGSNTFLTGRAVSELNIQEGQYQDLEQGDSRLELNLLHFFGANSSFRLGGAYNWYPSINASLFSSNIGASHRFADRRGTISLNMGLKSPVGERDDFQFTSSVNMSWVFQSGITAEITGARTYRTVFEDIPEYGISFGISQTLGFASGNTVGHRTDYFGTHNSFIGGVVFLDLNGNGIYDEGEPVISNVSMAAGGRRVRTNSEGVFMFESLFPGVYRVGVDELSLPVDYSIVTSEKIVEVRENENFFLNFALTVNGVISGRVFFDNNQSGTFDQGDEPLSFVGIYIDTLDRVFYTRRDGVFYIENVPLGKHNLKVMPSSLPGLTSVGEKAEFFIEITKEKLFAEGIEIPVVYDFGN